MTMTMMTTIFNTITLHWILTMAQQLSPNARRMEAARKSKTYHPFGEFRNDGETFDETVEEGLQEMLWHCNCHLERAPSPCRRFKKGRKGEEKHSCRCPSLFHRKDPVSVQVREAVARCMVLHCECSHEEQTRHVMEWMRHSKLKPGETDRLDNRRRFCLPVDLLPDHDGDKENNVIGSHLICKAALGHILDFRQRKWDKMKNAAKKGQSSLVHGNKDKAPPDKRRFEDAVEGDLIAFIEALKDKHAAPVSTKVVREATGSGLRDGEEGAVESPPHLTRRGCHRAFMNERGWEIAMDGRGREVERVAIEGMEQLEPCSWTSFNEVWHENFPLLASGKPSEDVCTHCHTFHNAFRSFNCEDDGSNAGVRQAVNEVDAIRQEVVGESESQEESGAVDEEDDTAMEFPINNAINMSLTKDRDMTERERLISEAHLHVRQASSQRTICNDEMETAQSDHKSNQPHHNSTRTVVMDCAQNCELPHFGDTQAGDSHHHSPLKVNVFGITDSAPVGGRSDAFVHHEGVGEKGGNNVASMLMLCLKNEGWLQKGNPGKELNAVMDNCPGQNENNHVLRLALFPVEQRCFRQVHFSFHVAGHAKNMCDRFFNTLKRQCGRRNVFAMDELVRLFNSSSNGVEVHALKAGDFEDWCSWENRLHDTIEDGHVKKNHVFSVKQPGVLEMKSDGVTKETFVQTGMDHKCRGRQKEILDKVVDEMDADVDPGEACHLKVLKAPGMSERKQILMGKDCRKLVPIQHLDDPICAIPPKDVLDKFRQKTNEYHRKQNAKKKGKKVEKADRKEAKSTTTTTTTTTTAPTGAPELTPEALAPAPAPKRRGRGQPIGSRDKNKRKPHGKKAPEPDPAPMPARAPVQSTSDPIIKDI